MLSAVIKNSILMLLLILIIHFIIINYITDLQQEYKLLKEVSVEEKPEIVISARVKPDEARSYSPQEKVVVKNEEHEAESKETNECNNQLKELYDFVYGDESAEADLGKLFDQIKPCDFDDNSLIKCTKQEKDDEISLCKNDTDIHHKSKAL